MKKSNKFFALFISALLIISLYGCGGKDEVKKTDIISDKTVISNEIEDENKEVEALEESPKKEKETPSKEEEQLVCTLTVDYSDIFEDISSLKKEKQYLLSESGIVLSLNETEFSDGESVFDVLKRELDKAGITLKYSQMPIGNNVYIEGIDNICEFDCGKSSGWLYTVNGEHPMLSSSQYKLKAGDRVNFIYKRKAY